MTDGDIVLTRDLSSGRFHKRLTLGTGLATLEGDNLDQSGAYEIVGELDPGTDPSLLCANCFPRPGFGPTVEETAP